MPTVVSSILRAATRDDSPLNILDFVTHERYQSCFSLVPHRFYSYRTPTSKKWETKYADIPDNYTLLPVGSVPADLDFDVIISQNKYNQYQIARQFSTAWQVPLVSLEHTLPLPNWQAGVRDQMNSMSGHVNVFLSDYSRDAWGWQGNCEIIPPGIDTELFTPEWELPRQPVLLSVVNDWINRDAFCGYNLWRGVTKDLPVYVLGDTPGLSRPAQNMDELVGTYQRCQIFLNTSLVSTCPFTLLEAMACNCAVISTDTTMIPQVIHSGVNGFLSNDPLELRSYCERLLADPELCKRIGREARKTVEEKYSFHIMAGNWDKVLRKTADIIINGEEFENQSITERRRDEVGNG